MDHDWCEIWPNRKMDFNEANITFVYNHLNETFPAPYQRVYSMRILGASFTVLLGITSILGNLAVVFTSFFDEALRDQTSNLLLVYLSVTDVLTGLFVIIPAAVSVAFEFWPFGDFLCKFHTSLAYTCSCSSSFNIFFISLDRAFAVAKPLQYPSIMNTKRILTLCMILFVMGASIFFPAMIFDWSVYDYTEGACGYDWNIYEVRFMASWGATSCFYLPAVAMGICNSLIIFSALKFRTKKLFVRRMEAAAREKTSNDSSMNKTIISVILVVIMYYVTYSPYCTSKHLRAVLGFTIPGQLNYLITLLYYLASAVNPFIYGILRKDYRNAYKKIPRFLSQKMCRRT